MTAILNPRVFLSSTIFDLLDARSELEDTIRAMGLQPVLSECATSEFDVLPDRNSIETCLANVRSSGHLILLIDRRYGPSLKASGFPDVSATHLEYLTAKEAGIPLFIFARDRFLGDKAVYEASNDAAKVRWIQPKDAAALVKFHKDVTTLAPGTTNNFYEPFRTSSDLCAMVTKRLGRFGRKLQVEKLVRDGLLPHIALFLTSSDFTARDNVLGSVRFRAAAFGGQCYRVRIVSGSGARVVDQGNLWPGGDHDFSLEGLRWNARSEQFEVTYETADGHRVVDRWELLLYSHQKTVSLVSRVVTPGDTPFVVVQD